MTRIEYGVACYDAILVLVGYGVVYGLGWTGLRPPDLRLVPLAFLTGWAAMGVVLSLGLLAGLDPSVSHVVIAAVAIVAVSILLRLRSGGRDELLRPSGGQIRAGFAGLRGSVRRPSRLACTGGLLLLVVAATIEAVARLGATVPSVVVSAAALGGVYAVADRRRLRELARNEPWRLLAGLAAAASVVVLLLATVAALIVAIKGEWPSEWDSWSIWLPRAETVFYWHGLDTGIGGWGSVAHPEYPPLLAVMYAASWHFAGGFHPGILPMQETLLGIGFVGGILALLDRFVPRWISFPSLALLAVAPGFWWRTQTLMADPPLGYLVAAAAVAALIWLATQRDVWLVAAAIFFAGATLTKLEGLSLGLLLVTTIVVTALIVHGRRAARGLVLLGGPAAVEPWRLWLSHHHLPSSPTDYHASELLHPLFLDHRLFRLTAALHWLLHSVFRTSQWLVVIPLALAAIVVVARRAPGPAAATLAWLVLGYLGLASVYWIGIPALDYYLDTSADRVASTLVIVAGAVTPLLLGLGLGRSGVAEPGVTVPELGATAPG